jgi:hypothetical protein
VVEVPFQASIASAKFVGAHAQCARIDVKTVNDH